MRARTPSSFFDTALEEILSIPIHEINKAVFRETLVGQRTAKRPAAILDFLTAVATRGRDSL